jgi:hypothetical protein
MKILHLPNNIAGVATALAEAERAHGHESKVITFNEGQFGFRGDEVLVAREASMPELLLRSCIAFVNNRSGYDVYHFNFGSSLLHAPRFGLNLADLPFYDSTAKKVFTFSGCDARQKYPTIERIKKTDANTPCTNADCYGGVCNSGKRDEYRSRAIEKASRHADHFFVLNPDLMHFLPAEISSFCPYVMGDLENLSLKGNPFFEDDEIHIIHAPTDRAAKGTSVILAVVEKLKAAYPGRIRLTLVENMQRTQALELYRSADLMIDQIMIGWYGGIAVEAMKMGVPVACYIEDSDLQFVPEQMAEDLPVIRVDEKNLFQQLEQIVRSREQLMDIGKLSAAYVNKWHDPMKVSQDILEIYAS